ncbi:MAG: hypothetical protein LUF85_03515 [Bacteroides sp.]|nr:hypothetical protein [Bacteroides sp.]
MKKELIPVLGVLSVSALIADELVIALTDHTSLSAEEMKSLKEKVNHKIRKYRNFYRKMKKQLLFLRNCSMILNNSKEL